MDWELYQTDFAHNINHVLVISDINRKVLYKKFKEFLEISLDRNLRNSASMAGYLKRINFYYFKQLIKNPEKILFALKLLFIIIKRKLSQKLSSKKIS
jgi:hypothetical protein